MNWFIAQYLYQFSAEGLSVGASETGRDGAVSDAGVMGGGGGLVDGVSI